MKVVLISGKAAHGKTFAATHALPHLPGKVEIMPLAGILKEQARMLGWNGEKDEKGRSLLQQLSWPVKNYHGEDYYARVVYKNACEHNLDILLIDDCRMLAEVNYFKSLLNEGKIDDLKIIRVVRPGYMSALTEEQLNDISETQLDNYSFDAVVYNDCDPETYGLRIAKVILD